jgi:hypothetical protein
MEPDRHPANPWTFNPNVLRAIASFFSPLIRLPD